MSSNMWIAIAQIIIGILMLVGLAIWLKKKSKNKPQNSSRDNLAELIETSKKLSENTTKNNPEVKG